MLTSTCNLSAKILNEIGQNTHFDTRPTPQIAQTCAPGHVVNHVNKRITCGNGKCCQARRSRFAFSRAQPRVKLGFLYNFSQKNQPKNFCVNARLTIATHSPFFELTKYTICHKLTKRDTHTIICPNDTPAKTCTTP